MTLKTLLDIVFGKTRKNAHLRKKAEEFLFLLKNNGGFVLVKDGRKFFGSKKAYYKVMRKLRSIGLISLSKDVDGNFMLTLTLDAYKFFVKRHLIEEVEQVLKVRS